MDNLVYNGTARTFNPKMISIYKNGFVLSPKIDYSISYKDNKEAGIAKMIVKPAGNFGGASLEVPFEIKHYNLVSEGTYINGDGEEVTENYFNFNTDNSKLEFIESGKEIKPVPELKVRLNDKYIKLKAGSKNGKGDFYVEYPDKEEGAYVKPGSWKITVTGMGNYEGTAELYMAIYSKENAVPMSKCKIIPEKTKYAFEELFDTSDGYTDIKMPKLTVMDGKKVVDPSKYNVFWFSSEWESDKIILGVEGNGDATDTDPTRYCGSAYVTIPFSCTKLTSSNVEIVWPDKEYFYDTGSWSWLDEFSVKVNGSELRRNQDYWLIRAEFTKGKTDAKISIQCNDYYGYSGEYTFEKSFKTYALSDFDYHVKDQTDGTDKEVIYGKSAKSEIGCRYSKKGANPVIYSASLTKEDGSTYNIYRNTDYTVKYTNNKKAGNKAYIEVTGIGRYKGQSFKIPFTVLPGDLSKVAINAPDAIYNLKKFNSWISKPVLTAPDGTKLKEGTDYKKLTEDDYFYVGKNAGYPMEPGTEIKITITGAGNYEGSTAICIYRIINADSSIAKAKFKIRDKKYVKGSKVYLTADDFTTAIAADKTTNLTLGEDFIITDYSKNDKKGTAKVTLRGRGHWGGSQTVSFKIVPADL